MTPLKLLNMVRSQQLIQIELDNKSNHLKVNYAQQTTRTIYDVCDYNGRILKTGSVKKNVAKVDVSDLENTNYVLLILDGDMMTSRKFSLKSRSVVH